VTTQPSSGPSGHLPPRGEGKEGFPSPLGRPVSERPAPEATESLIRGQGEGSEPLRFFLEWGWVLPLGLGLGVCQIYESLVRPVALISAVVWAGAVLSRYRQRLPVSGVSVFVAIFAGAGLSFSAFPSRTLEDLSLGVAGFFLFQGFSVFIQSDETRFSKIIRVLVVMGLLRAVLGLFSISWPAPDGKWVPAFDWPNSAIVAMGLGAVVLLGRSVTGAWRIFSASLTTLTFYLAFHWNAMGALWGLCLCLWLWAWFRRPRPWFWWVLVVLVFGVVLSLSGYGPVWMQYNPSDAHRFERWRYYQELWPWIKDHWFWGTGLGTFAEYYPAYATESGLRVANFAHNEGLQFFCEMGIPGGLLILFLGAKGIVKAWGCRQEFPEAVATIFAVGLWSTVYFVFHWEFILFMGALALAVVFRSPPIPLRLGARGVGLAVVGFVVIVQLFQGAGRVGALVAWRHERMGDTPGALRWFQRASRVDPLSPEYPLRQMEIFRSMDRKAEALVAVEKALRCRPRDVWTRRLVSVGRLHQIGRESACLAYAPLLTLAPQVPQFRQEFSELCEPPKKP